MVHLLRSSVLGYYGVGLDSQAALSSMFVVPKCGHLPWLGRDLKASECWEMLVQPEHQRGKANNCDHRVRLAVRGEVTKELYCIIQINWYYSRTVPRVSRGGAARLLKHRAGNMAGT